MNKLILGFTGQIASGKGTSALYLKETYGATTYRFSTILRDLVDRIYIPQNRHNLQTISRIIRENFGEGILAKAMAEDVKNDTSKIIAIDGIRRPSDVEYLKNVPGFVLVSLEATIEKRYERITSRGENTDDNKKTFNEFKKEHEAESELTISEIASQATECIDNNRSIEYLHKQLDQLIKKYGN